MLEIKDLKVAYGRVLAVKGISFTVDQGQVVTLVGTNGAGKTTTLRTISGLIKPESGEIWFEGERIDATPAHQMLTRGLAHSPEGRRIFPRLSVEDNLMLGAFARKDKAGIAQDLDRVFELFDSSGSDGPSRPVRSPVRAADARNRPGDDEQAEAADARRAIDGPLAADDAADHVDHRRTAMGGCDDPAGGAECARGAGAGRLRVCTRRSARSCWRTRVRRC